MEQFPPGAGSEPALPRTVHRFAGHLWQHCFDEVAQDVLIFVESFWCSFLWFSKLDGFSDFRKLCIYSLLWHCSYCLILLSISYDAGVLEFVVFQTSGRAFSSWQWFPCNMGPDVGHSMAKWTDVEDAKEVRPQILVNRSFWIRDCVRTSVVFSCFIFFCLLLQKGLNYQTTDYVILFLLLKQIQGFRLLCESNCCFGQGFYTGWVFLFSASFHVLFVPMKWGSPMFIIKYSYTYSAFRRSIHIVCGVMSCNKFIFPWAFGIFSALCLECSLENQCSVCGTPLVSGFSAVEKFRRSSEKPLALNTKSPKEFVFKWQLYCDTITLQIHMKQHRFLVVFVFLVCVLCVPFLGLFIVALIFEARVSPL